MRLIILMTMLAALTACATQPQEAAPVSSTPNPASPMAAVAAPAVGGDATAEEAEFRAPAGYDRKSRGGQTVYCRYQTPVGTRFATEYCFTQADLERIERNKRSVQDDVEQRTRMCTTGAACGGGG